MLESEEGNFLLFPLISSNENERISQGHLLFQQTSYLKFRVPNLSVFDVPISGAFIDI